MSNNPKSSLCRECGKEFPFRRSKKFCSPNCRKASSQRNRRQETPANAASSRSVKRDQHEVFELASRMSETLYTLPPDQRLGYIEEIVQLARSGDCPMVRKILTLPSLIRPNPEKTYLFFRRSRSYLTISQAADRYCRSSPWNAGVAEVVRGEVPDPPTGEVSDEVVVAA